MRKALVVAALTTIVLTGCGGEEPSGPADETSRAVPTPATGAADPTTSPSAADGITITFADGTVTPNGKRVEVAVGEPVRLVVEADEPGELHVHATPEEELSYDEGRTELELTIDQPGIVDVESHGLGVVVLQLEVS